MFKNQEQIRKNTERQFMKHYGQTLTFLDGLNIVMEAQIAINQERRNHPNLSEKDQDAFLTKTYNDHFAKYYQDYNIVPENKRSILYKNL